MLTSAQIDLVRNGVLSTVRSITYPSTGKAAKRDNDRKALISALHMYTLDEQDFDTVGAWCWSRLGYGGRQIAGH